MSLEAVLAFPVVLLCAGVVTQSMLLAQNRTYVEQAAYAAARSAMVHLCPPDDIFRALTSSWTQILEQDCTPNPQKWEDAARWALVSASPSSDFAVNRGTCQPVEAGVELLTGHPMRSAAEDIFRGSVTPRDLTTAIENRICYAFETDNVHVEVDWKRDWISTLSRVFSGHPNVGTLPVEATVTFRAPLTTPIQRLLADGERSDGTRWREMTATVVLQ